MALYVRYSLSCSSDFCTPYVSTSTKNPIFLQKSLKYPKKQKKAKKAKICQKSQIFSKKNPKNPKNSKNGLRDLCYLHGLLGRLGPSHGVKNKAKNKS
jgi:hypothetical protein